MLSFVNIFDNHFNDKDNYIKKDLKNYKMDDIKDTIKFIFKKFEGPDNSAFNPSAPYKCAKKYHWFEEVVTFLAVLSKCDELDYEFNIYVTSFFSKLDEYYSNNLLSSVIKENAFSTFLDVQIHCSIENKDIMQIIKNLPIESLD